MVLVATQDVSSMKALHLFSRVLAKTAYSPDKLSVALTSMACDPELDAKHWLEKNNVFVHESRHVPLDPDIVHSSIASGIPYSLGDRESDVAGFSRHLVELFLNQRPQTGRNETVWTKFQGALNQVFSG
jgi:hypothetical protein